MKNQEIYNDEKVKYCYVEAKGNRRITFAFSEKDNGVAYAVAIQSPKDRLLWGFSTCT